MHYTQLGHSSSTKDDRPAAIKASTQARTHSLEQPEVSIRPHLFSRGSDEVASLFLTGRRSPHHHSRHTCNTFHTRSLHRYLLSGPSPRPETASASAPWAIPRLYQVLRLCSESGTIYHDVICESCTESSPACCIRSPSGPAPSRGLLVLLRQSHTRPINQRAPDGRVLRPV